MGVLSTLTATVSIIKDSKVILVAKKPVVFVLSKVAKINDGVDKLVGLPDKVDKGLTIVTKTTGLTFGTMGAAKGTTDLAEAILCQDGICATVSAIGLAADGLQIIASFVPGPNVTVVVTLPVSVGCKVFVECCKRSKLPWGC